MPSIVFSDLVEGLIGDVDVADDIAQLIEQKSQESEQSLLCVSATIYDFFASMYHSLIEDFDFAHGPSFVSNDGFRSLLR